MNKKIRVCKIRRSHGSHGLTVGNQIRQKKPPLCRKIVLKNGFEVTLFRLDDPQFGAVAKACEKIADESTVKPHELGWFCCVELKIKQETIHLVLYYLVFYKPPFDEIEEDLNEKFQKTVESATFLVYQNTAYKPSSQAGKILKHAVFNRIPPNISALTCDK